MQGHFGKKVHGKMKDDFLTFLKFMQFFMILTFHELEEFLHNTKEGNHLSTTII